MRALAPTARAGLSALLASALGAGALHPPGALADDPAPGAVGTDRAAPTSGAPAGAPPAPALPRDPFDGLVLPERPFAVTRLANGLTVVVDQDDTRPRVAVAVEYHVGSGDDPVGYFGLAHLAEHVMFQGSRHVAEDRVFRELELAGATSVNAQTTPDRTVFYEEVPRHQLERALWIESDRMAFVLEHLDRKTLGNQREVVRAEWRSRFGSSPVGSLQGHLMRALFPPGHPYRRADDPEDIAGIALDDVRWFIQRHYRPDNAILSLAGGVTLAEGERLARKWFGDVRAVPGVSPAPPELAPDPATLEAESGPRRLVLDAPVGAELLFLAWRTPSWQAPLDAALDYVAAMLAGTDDTPLRRALRAAGIHPRAVSAQQYSQDLASYFLITIVGSDDSRPREVLPALSAELRRLATRGPTPTELRWARGRWLRIEFQAADDLVARATANAHLVRLVGTDAPRDVAERARYGSVDADDVRAAVRRHLAPARATEVHVRPNPRAPTGGALIYEGSR